jgi:peptide/nickel transport system substrate-binding protein
MNKTKQGEYTKYTMQREPEMSTHFIMFNHMNKTFSDRNVRKAISFAIDRTKILEYVLQGEGFKPGINGIVPPVFEGYDINKIRGYEINLDSAKYYLAKAGYPSGKNFPKTTIYLNSDAERNVYVLQEIQKQLKDNLNIDVDIQVLPFAQHLENAMKGKSEMFRIGWLADFPNPENFLYLFYGKNVNSNEVSFPNICRYKNPEYDAYYDKAILANSIEEAVENYMKAEQVLMNDAAVVVLWYDEGYRLLQPYVQNFPNNPMQYRDLSDVYFKK